MMRSLLLSATLVLGMTACGKSSTEEAPKTEQAAKKGAKKKGKKGKKAQAKKGKAGKKGKKGAGKKAQAKQQPRTLEGNKYGFGAVNGKNAPDVDALNAKLKNGLKARAAVDAPEGVTVQLIEGAEVVINLEPTADGKNIARAWAVAPQVAFPHNMRVGMPLGRHPKVAEMTCTDADGALAGMALCQVNEEGTVSFAVAKDLASADKLKDAPVQALVWTRADKPEAVAQKADEPKAEEQK